MTSETIPGKPSSHRWPPLADTVLKILLPAYPIDSPKMRPVTKITVFGIRLAIAVLALYWIALFVGTHLPGAATVTKNVNDKVQHFSAFFVLGGLLCYVTNSPRWFARFATIGAVGMAYAAIDELTQGFIPRRVPDFADFAADSLGLWCAIAIYVTIKFVHHLWTSQTLSQPS